MRWDVTSRTDSGDMFVAPATPDARRLVVPVDVAGAPHAVRNNVWSRLDAAGLEPAQAAMDLYRAAAAAFACDLRIPRSSGYDGWTRDIKLYLPVSDLGRWGSVLDPLTELLRFLTGDHWEVVLREQEAPRPPANEKLKQKANPLDTDAVCLLSGGLDSFVGAADALARGIPLYLVSHHGGGSGVHASPAQDEVVRALASRYGLGALRHVKFNLDPPKGLTGQLEPTTRSRSIVFLALATLVASALGRGARLLVPENGLISLNVPLTYSRLGSLSTRTTHPHTLALFKEMLSGIGLDVRVENPYQFSTKGEMLKDAEDAEFVAEVTPRTMSCAHPSAGRWQGRGVEHCGYCVPCIIRRAAEYEAGIGGTSYTFDVRREELGPEAAKDPRAFRVAVERASDGVDLADVLVSGPLGVDPATLNSYVDLHARGLDEVGRFLSS